MKIGIISGCKRKKNFLSFLRHKRIKENIIKQDDFEITIFEVICSPKKIEKKIKKAKERLSLKGCQLILKDKGLKSESEAEKTKVLEDKVFFDLAFELYKEYLKFLELKAYKMHILIIDKDCTAICKAVLERICFYSSKCDILTDNTEKAKRLADHIFKQNGFFANVRKETVQSGYDAVFDIDNKTLKVDAKIFINKIDFGLESLSEYNISLLETAEKLKDAGFRLCYTKTVGTRAYFEIK